MPPKKTQARAPQNGRANPVQARALEAGDAAEREIREVQAAAEGVVTGAETITFMGEKFKIADAIGLMPLLKFANAADRGMQSEDMAGMAAMYVMIRDCIDQGHACTCGAADGEPHKTATDAEPGCEFDPGDWPRFEDHAISTKADGDDLFAVVTDVIEVISARPTRPRSGSSRAERRRSARSRASSPPQAEGLVAVDGLLRS